MKRMNQADLGEPKILIQIEHRSTAERLANLATANGIKPFLAYSDLEFDEMTLSNEFDAVVTRTALIGKICLKVQLPIINIDRFVFTVIEHDSDAAAAKRLDGEKFVAEVFELKHLHSSDQILGRRGYDTRHSVAA